MLLKRDVMIIIFFLLFTTTIITAVQIKDYGDDDDDDDDHSAFETYGSSSSTGNYEPSRGIENLYLGGNDNSGPDSGALENTEIVPDDMVEDVCWKRMQQKCKHPHPIAIFVAQVAIERWIWDDMFNDRYVGIYYNDLYDNLIPGEMDEPNVWCERKEGKNPQKNDFGFTRCQVELRYFGDNRWSALRHAYFHTKITDEEEEDNRIENDKDNSLDALNVAQEPNFKEDYVKHIIENVRINGIVDSPLQFCIQERSKRNNYGRSGKQQLRIK